MGWQLEFFAHDRVGILLNEKLQELLRAVIFDAGPSLVDANMLGPNFDHASTTRFDHTMTVLTTVHQCVDGGLTFR